MNLKCVGGPCDGQTEFVNDDYRYGDQVRIAGPTDDPGIDQYHLYLLTQVSSGTHKIMFLRDTYMSDLQAFEHLIKNHG